MMKHFMLIWSLLFGAMAMSYAADKDMVATEFSAAYKSINELERALTANGFEMLGMHPVAGNTNYTSVLYTSPALKKLGSAPNRGFVSIMRILHDAKSKQLMVSNPEYTIRAFYQKTYKDGMETATLTALKSALGPLTPTEDSLRADKLSKYNFMIGMPKYDDFQRVAKGNVSTLSSRLESAAGERIVFKLDIKGDGSSLLYGVALPAAIEKFNETLGTMGRSQLLPYTVLIENGSARILHAKFYLALSFPNLSMGEFMKIRSIPGDVKDRFELFLK